MPLAAMCQGHGNHGWDWFDRTSPRRSVTAAIHIYVIIYRDADFTTIAFEKGSAVQSSPDFGVRGMPASQVMTVTRNKPVNGCW